MASVHIIGAGLSGLATACRLAARGYTGRICLYEASGHAGGRCRSYHDPVLNRTIDNGNHLLIKANRQTFDFIEQIGARAEWISPASNYRIHDLHYDREWFWNPPYWIPALPLWEYRHLLSLLMTPDSASVADCVPAHSLLYRRLIRPLTVSALNTPPEDASAKALRALLMALIRQRPDAAHPFVARHSLQAALIDPALAYLREQGVNLYFQMRLKSVDSADAGPTILHFTDQSIELDRADHAILALPPYELTRILPSIAMPDTFSAIINGHFLCDHSFEPGSILGLVGGIADWLFFKDGMVSTTTSAANAHLGHSQDDIAAMLWNDINRTLNQSKPIPPYRIVTEKRATILATPANEALRPKMQTPIAGLLLAGDVVQHGLPATIESSVVSGYRAADAIHA